MRQGTDDPNARRYDGAAGWRTARTLLPTPWRANAGSVNLTGFGGHSGEAHMALGKPPYRFRSWLAGFAASVLSAAAVAWITASLTLRDHVSESTVVFNSVGVRYFFAVHQAFMPGGVEPTGEQLKVYHAVLRDIREDMRWSRSYSFLAKRSMDHALALNAIIEELETNADVAFGRKLLVLMCGTYVDSDLWVKANPEDARVAEVRQFAQRVCEEYG